MSSPRMNHRGSTWRSRTRGISALILIAVAGQWLGACVMLEVAALNRRDLTEFRAAGDRLYMANEINSRTLDQFNTVIAGHPEIQTLVLTVVPGSLDDEVNLQLGERVRELGLATHLVSGGLIASGGVDLFLAGAQRTIEKGSYVGVHSWAAGFGRTGAEVSRDNPQHRLYLDYYQAIDIVDSFYWFTLEAAPAGEMHWMTLDEIERYGMITGPPMEPADEPGPFLDKLLEIRNEVEERLDDGPLTVDEQRPGR